MLRYGILLTTYTKELQVAWPKSDDKKTETITLKISKRQLQILERYAEIKELTEPEALRRMIDGAGDFVAKHDGGLLQATVAPAHQTTPQTGPEHHIDGGQDITSEVGEEEAHSGPGASLGYIGRRLNVGLPGGGGDYQDDGEDLVGDGG